jgi:hypothetical protein
MTCTCPGECVLHQGPQRWCVKCGTRPPEGGGGVFCNRCLNDKIGGRRPTAADDTEGVERLPIADAARRGDIDEVIRLHAEAEAQAYNDGCRVSQPDLDAAEQRGRDAERERCLESVERWRTAAIVGCDAVVDALRDTKSARGK